MSCLKTMTGALDSLQISEVEHAGERKKLPCLFLITMTGVLDRLQISEGHLGGERKELPCLV